MKNSNLNFKSIWTIEILISVSMTHESVSSDSQAIVNCHYLKLLIENATVYLINFLTYAVYL